ncbi:MAG TPA: BatD family protein [Polyangia bacterium]
MTRNIRRLFIALSGALVLAGGARAWAGPAQPAASPVSGRDARAPARAFVKLDVRPERGAHGLFVGQAVPVTIRAYFLGGTGVSLNGLPRTTSDAFVLSDLPEKPRQAVIETHGLPYTSVTWTGVLTAVKAGEAKIGIELPVSLTYREAPQPRRAAGPNPAAGDDDDTGDQSSADPFASILKQIPFASDPFFAQMFNGRDPFQGMLDDLTGSVRQRDVTLRDQSGAWRVLDTPPGAPAAFSGAVGQFEVSAALANDTVHVGEPTTLKLTVRGRGSFPRLAVSGLPPSDGLNTYGVTSTFTPGPTPTAGEKVFAQTIAPRRAGPLTVPALAVTYLDPQQRRYVTRRTAPLRITVAPGDSGPDTASRASATGAAAPAEAAAGDSAMSAEAANKTVGAVSATVRSTLTPNFRARWFQWLTVTIALGAVVLALVGRTYRNGALGRFMAARRVGREIARQRRTVDVAAATGDATMLFGAARKAFQARLGAAWGVPSEAIAAADVAHRLGPTGDRIHAVFERADRLTYSGNSSVPSEDLSYWRGLVSDELRALEATT